MHAGIDEAALTLIRMGRVHAVSCMSSLPRWPDAAQSLKNFDSKSVDVGLHLNLTESPGGDRFGEPLSQLIVKAYCGLLPINEIEREINRQFDEFEAAMSRSPAFIDGHQHIHQLPDVQEIVLRAIAVRYPMKKPWLRSTRPSRNARFGGRSSGKKSLIHALGGRAFDKQARKLGCSQNSGFLGVYNFTGSAQQYLQRLKDWFEASQHGALLMCHPSAASATIGDSNDVILPARLKEFQALTSDEFRNIATQSNVTLQPLSQLFR